MEYFVFQKGNLSAGLPDVCTGVAVASLSNQLISLLWTTTADDRKQRKHVSVTTVQS